MQGKSSFMKYEKIWKLSKETNLAFLRRRYEWWNSLFIAFLVVFILQLTNVLRQTFYRPRPSTLIIEWLILAFILIFVFISVRNRSKHEIAVEVREQKLGKSKALDYICEMWNAL